MLKCSQCGYEGPTPYCPQCGRQMEVVCSQCRCLSSAEFDFCPECGNSLAPAKASSSEQGQGGSSFGDIGLVRGTLDSSTHVTTNIGSQTNITGAVGAVHVTQHPPEATAEQLFQRGLDSLRSKTYGPAISSLEASIKEGYTSADVHYYMALALLRGQRPKLLGLSTIRTIENHLRRALEIDGQSDHVSVLWALVKEDYYVMNRMFDRPPTVSHLIKQSGPVSPEHVSELLTHIPATGNRVWEAMRQD